MSAGSAGASVLIKKLRTRKRPLATGPGSMPENGRPFFLESAMRDLAVIELKAFVPAKDFELSKRFYAELGFTQRSEGGGVAYFSRDHCAFLLQDYYNKEFAENCVMHLLVADAQAWHRMVHDSGLAQRYGVKVTAVTEQPWGITEFVIIDPAGVCWHIGQNTPGFRVGTAG